MYLCIDSIYMYVYTRCDAELCLQRRQCRQSGSRSNTLLRRHVCPPVQRPLTCKQNAGWGDYGDHRERREQFLCIRALCFSVLDLEDAPLLQVVHLLEDERHVVAQLVEFRHGHLQRRKDGKHRRSSFR